MAVHSEKSIETVSQRLRSLVQLTNLTEFSLGHSLNPGALGSKNPGNLPVFDH